MTGKRKAIAGRACLQIHGMRHGEEAMDAFHDEVGNILWDKENQQVIRTLVFVGGIAIMDGADAKATDKEIHFKAGPEIHAIVFFKINTYWAGLNLKALQVLSNLMTTVGAQSGLEMHQMM